MTAEISQELAQRMAAFVRNLASSSSASPIFRQAAEIVALLPEPVDPDLVEARRMAADLNQGSERAKWMAGRWDTGPAVEWHLAGIRRGRELAKARAGEGSV